jgi:hypothetical protein
MKIDEKREKQLKEIRTCLENGVGKDGGNVVREIYSRLVKIITKQTNKEFPNEITRDDAFNRFARYILHLKEKTAGPCNFFYSSLKNQIVRYIDNGDGSSALDKVAEEISNYRE